MSDAQIGGKVQTRLLTCACFFLMPGRPVTTNRSGSLPGLKHSFFARLQAFVVIVHAEPSRHEVHYWVQLSGPIARKEYLVVSNAKLPRRFPSTTEMLRSRALGPRFDREVSTGPRLLPGETELSDGDVFKFNSRFNFMRRR